MRCRCFHYPIVSVVITVVVCVKSETDVTYETSNSSIVSGLVDYMSTLVSGVGDTVNDRGRSDMAPPVPPKLNRGSSADRAKPAKPVRIELSSSVLDFGVPASEN